MRRLLPSLGLFLITLAGCQCGNVRIGTVRPHIEADPASLDFGSTAVGFPVEKSVALLNQSHAVLHLEEVSLIGEAAQAFTTSLPEVVDVEAGASVSVRVVYSPGAEGNHSARLLVRSDAANAPELLVPLAGEITLARSPPLAESSAGATTPTVRWATALRPSASFRRTSPGFPSASLKSLEGRPTPARVPPLVVSSAGVTMAPARWAIARQSPVSLRPTSSPSPEADVHRQSCIASASSIASTRARLAGKTSV